MQWVQVCREPHDIDRICERFLEYNKADYEKEQQTVPNEVESFTSDLVAIVKHVSFLNCADLVTHCFSDESMFAVDCSMMFILVSFIFIPQN